MTLVFCAALRNHDKNLITRGKLLLLGFITLRFPLLSSVSFHCVSIKESRQIFLHIVRIHQVYAFYIVMASEGAAYSPDTSPKRRDWADINHDDKGQYGVGPGLKDPNDPIQNSERANENHQEKAANAVGAGPSIRRPSNNSPKYEHFEQRDDARSSEAENYHLANAPATQTDNALTGSTKTQEELEHHSALSSIRTKLGLEAEPPILDGHHVHNHLTWSSVRVIFREPFAEFFGVFIMVLFGNGSVAQVLLSAGEATAPGKDGFGPYQSISWG
jgi:aquaglyceroporin related protein